MVFSSLPFLFRFLPIILLFYFAAPPKYRNGILFIFSLIFYAWGEPIYVLLMIFSIILNYMSGIIINKYQRKDMQFKAKSTLIISIMLNLSMLGFFKYFDFLIETLNQLLNSDINLLHLALPIGISFYTFQAMSYVIDVYKGVVAPQSNIVTFGSYVSMFPQLIAGPIVQYKTVAEELTSRKETYDAFSNGIQLFLIGLGKKVLLANNIGLLWNEINLLPKDNLPMLTAWIGMFAFTFQIYFDFSGYSDMAMGLGRMFGFHFPKNFNYPYTAKSITDFWRKWHITLSSWFREYVYIPLGGNRDGKFKQIRNIAIVWLLTGFWHGASWNFILWGAYYGILLILEKIVLLKILDKSPGFIRHIYTLFFVVCGWVFFSIDQLGDILIYFKAMFGLNGVTVFNTETCYLLYSNGILFLLLIIGSTTLPKKLGCFIMKKFTDYPLLKVISACGFFSLVILLSLAYLVDATYNPFLYFRF